MTDEKNSNSLETLLAELRRRKIVQFALAYCLISWVIVQVADVALPVYGAPDWALQATITMLIVAFPPLLIHAWLYNLTTSGVELTKDTPWSARIRHGWMRVALSSAIAPRQRSSRLASCPESRIA